MPTPTAAPAPPAALNLDTLEREGGSPTPFDFVHQGRRYILGDPNELDWQTMLSVMHNPVRMIQALLPTDDQKDFFRAPMPAWKLNALFDAYMDHYGLPKPGETTPGI